MLLMKYRNNPYDKDVKDQVKIISVSASAQRKQTWLRFLSGRGCTLSPLSITRTLASHRCLSGYGCEIGWIAPSLVMSYNDLRGQLFEKMQMA